MVVDTDPVVDDGHFIPVDISDRWNALGGSPNGGYLAVTCVGPLLDQIPYADPVVVTSTYVRRARPGPAHVTASTLRVGRRFAHGTATLIQDGEPVVHTTATFADLVRFEGASHMSMTPPDLPAPDRCYDVAGSLYLPGVTIIDRVEYRVPEVPGWARGEPTGNPQAEFWMRFTDGTGPDTSNLPLLVDAAAPVVLELGVAGSSTIELTTHVRARPAPGWLACRVATRCLVDGVHEEDLELWDSAGQLVAQARQLAIIPSG